MSFVRYKLPFAKKSATPPSAFSGLSPPHKLAWIVNHSFPVCLAFFFITSFSLSPRNVADAKAYGGKMRAFLATLKYTCYRSGKERP
jgi:hypothetical protein